MEIILKAIIVLWVIVQEIHVLNNTEALVHDAS